MAAARALFVRDGEWFHPTELTTGPWRPDAMHGGPPSALLAAVIDESAQPGEHIARVNIELERPVPIEPLTAIVTRHQVSRRVGRVDVLLNTATRTVASARALLLRTEPIPEPEWTEDLEPVVIAGPEHTFDPPGGAHDSPVFYHRDAVEHRVLVGGLGVAGPSISWSRLRCTVLQDEEPRGLSSLFAVADFGSAFAQVLAPDAGVGLINVDVSAALARRPVGEWFRLDAKAILHPDGAGLAITHLTDGDGPLGIVNQSQIGHVYAF